jgi:hypothetical protein
MKGATAMKFFLICGMFVLPSPAIFAQAGPASVSIALQMQTGRAYKTASPYCTTKEYLPTKTPPKGTKVNHTERMCRDSLGRGRDEITPTLIEIYDPVEGVGYTLDTVHRRAGSTAIARRLSGNRSTSVPRSENFAPGTPSRMVQLLGTEVIEGLVVEGTRRPTGLELLAEGDEEIWFSQELGEAIVVFRVPSNYTIEDTPH